MNWLDFVFLGIIAASVLISLVRGFVREVLSIVVWVAAFWLALRYSDGLAARLEPFVGSPTIRLVAAFAGLFIITLLLGALLNYLAGQLVGRTGLSGTDRALGVVFGGLRGLAIVALLVLAAGLTAVPGERWWQESLLAGRLQPWVCRAGVGDWLDGLRVYQPLAAEPAEGTPAPDYWRDFCGQVAAGDGREADNTEG